MSKKKKTPKMPLLRKPIAEKPNSRHKSKKDYDRKKDKVKLKKEVNED